MPAKRLGVCFVLLVFLSGSGGAQERGDIQLFGSEGRLFSSGTIDYFLLSRRSYMTEDSTGYEGDVRAVRKFEGGGYQIILKRYVARCVAPFDHQTQVAWSNMGEEGSNLQSVKIVNPSKFPGQENKESYNLYWAACFEKFLKFK